MAGVVVGIGHDVNTSTPAGGGGRLGADVGERALQLGGVLLDAARAALQEAVLRAQRSYYPHDTELQLAVLTFLFAACNDATPRQCVRLARVHKVVDLLWVLLGPCPRRGGPGRRRQTRS